MGKMIWKAFFMILSLPSFPYTLSLEIFNMETEINQIKKVVKKNFTKIQLKYQVKICFPYFEVDLEF